MQEKASIVALETTEELVSSFWAGHTSAFGKSLNPEVRQCAKLFERVNNLITKALQSELNDTKQETESLESILLQAKKEARRYYFLTKREQKKLNDRKQLINELEAELATDRGEVDSNPDASDEEGVANAASTDAEIGVESGVGLQK